MNTGQIISLLVKSECKVNNLTRDNEKLKKELEDIKSYINEYLPII